MAHIHGKAMLDVAGKAGAQMHHLVTEHGAMPVAALAGTAGVAAVTTAGHKAGRSFLGRVLRHPVVVFGLGVTAGYYIHKYRKEILATAVSVSEQGKDFVLNQRENLEDLLAEVKESSEQTDS